MADGYCTCYGDQIGRTADCGIAAHRSAAKVKNDSALTLRDRIAAALLGSWDERQTRRVCWPDPRSLHCQDCADADADAVIAKLDMRQCTNPHCHCEHAYVTD